MKRLIGAITLVALVAACASPEAPSSPSPTSTGAAAPTLTAPPTPEPSPSPSPSVATPSPTSSPSATPSPSQPPPSPTAEPASPTPAAGEPVAPSRIARFYDQIALGAESSGIAHIAAGTTNGIVHLTNATGAWERERITDAPAGGYDGDPVVAIDDGAVHVAFTRYETWTCQGFGCWPQDPQAIYVVQLGPDGWSTPIEVAGPRSMQPSLAVRDGILHLAFERFDRSGVTRIMYATGTPASFTSETIADNAYSPMLRVAADGTARVAFHNAATDELRYASAASTTGSFSIEPGPPGMSATFDLDAADRPHFVGPVGYTTSDGQGWAPPLQVFSPGRDEDVYPGAVAVAADGTVHVVSENSFSSGNGVWYGRLVGGTFETAQVYEPASPIEDGPPGSAAVAVDDGGRVHLAFTVISGGMRSGLWYARDAQ